MSCYDVFNGDADGIFSLIQLRRTYPEQRTLITGVKRDIALLDRVVNVDGEPEAVTVLDISLDRNRQPLQRLLQQGCRVEYWDHHFAGEIPDHPNLVAYLDPSPEQCTSLLVDKSLVGAQSAWALAGAFGDNLDKVATALGRRRGYSEAQLAQLNRLGQLVNYNSYGRTLDDLYFAPDELYTALQQFPTPFDALADSGSPVAILSQGYQSDLALAQAQGPMEQTARTLVWLLPDAGWAHRISGSWANLLSNQHPQKAVALVTPAGKNHFRLSVRAPARGSFAPVVDICRRFGGGGRVRAGGIDALHREDMADFLQQWADHFDDNGVMVES